MDTLGEGKRTELFHTLSSLGIAALVLDARDKVILANAVASDIFGIDVHELTQMNVRALIPDLIPSKTIEADAVSMRCNHKTQEGFSANVSVVKVQDDPAYEAGVALVAIRELRPDAASVTIDKEISVFNYLASALARQGSVENFLRDIVRHLPTLMGCDAGCAHLVDDKGLIQLVSCDGCLDECVEGIKQLQPQQCLIGKVYSSGEPIMVRDLSTDNIITNINAESSGLVSMLSVPISSSGKVLGVLSLASHEPEYFNEVDIKILAVVGNQLGVAVENAALIAQLQKRMEQIELINEISSTINSSLSIGTLFRIMVTEARRLVNFDRASLLLYNEKDDDLLILALETQMKTIMPKGVQAPISGTSAGWVVKNNEPYINYDFRKEIPFPLDKKLYDEGIRSTVSIPLYQDRVLGVFNLDSIEPNKYSRDDLSLLVPVSKHISIALENTFLFEQVSREKKEWEKTFDAISDMVWIEDNDNIVIRANSATLNKSELSFSELRGMHCSDLLARMGIDSLECLCAVEPDMERDTFKELKEASGNVYHFWSYPLKDENGRLYATVHYLKDMTAYKRIEQQLVRNDKLASLGILVAGIAHEINNPLGIIAGYAEALIDRTDDERLLNQAGFEDFPEYLETIHKEIFRCKEILGSLLEFARPHSGKTRELDINELIKEVMLLVKHRAKSLNYDLELNLNPRLPKIFAEPGGLRQLFLNIIINAMYYTPEGGKVIIESSIDEGTSASDRQMLSIAISDNGSGIPEDIQGKIFDPFFTTKPTGMGTGLGLSICHRIAEENGGMIELVSAPGDGATFIIKLPAVHSGD